MQISLPIQFLSFFWCTGKNSNFNFELKINVKKFFKDNLRENIIFSLDPDPHCLKMLDLDLHEMYANPKHLTLLGFWGGKVPKIVS